jgi:hypothetical protein
LQAISEVFLALADWRVPHFPVTLVYELGSTTRQTVIVAASRVETQTEPSFWVSINHFFDHTASTEDFQTLIDGLYKEPSQTQYRSIIAPGNWTGMATPQLSYLPQTILAYTTGALAPWQALWQHNRNTMGIDSLIEDQDNAAEMERPAGWTWARELQENKEDMQRDGESKQNFSFFGWQPILITQQLLKFDLLGRLNEIGDSETWQNLASSSYQGEALLSLLNDHGDASAFQRFQLLYDLHREGLFETLNICLRKMSILSIMPWASQLRKFLFSHIPLSF